MLAERIAKSVEVGSGIGCQNHISHEALITGTVFAGNDQALPNVRMLVKRTDDFVWLDPVAPDFDLVVDASQKGNIAVWQQTAEVSCFVEPAARFGAKRVRNKLLTRQVWAVAIAPRQPRAPNVNFAQCARRYRMETLIQKVDFCVGDGPADVRQCRGTLIRQHRRGGSHHRTLRGPVIVDQHEG